MQKVSTYSFLLLFCVFSIHISFAQDDYYKGPVKDKKQSYDKLDLSQDTVISNQILFKQIIAGEVAGILLSTVLATTFGVMAYNVEGYFGILTFLAISSGAAFGYSFGTPVGVGFVGKKFALRGSYWDAFEGTMIGSGLSYVFWVGSVLVLSAIGLEPIAYAITFIAAWIPPIFAAIAYNRAHKEQVIKQTKKEKNDIKKSD
jgi:hypothetical protein